MADRNINGSYPAAYLGFGSYCVAVLALISLHFHFIFLKQSIDLVDLVSYHSEQKGEIHSPSE